MSIVCNTYQEFRVWVEIKDLLIIKHISNDKEILNKVAF